MSRLTRRAVLPATPSIGMARSHHIDTGELLSSACKGAEEMMRTADVAARVTAEWMRKIHGGEWRVQIEHADGLIVIARRLGGARQPIDPSSLREAV